MQLNPTKAYYIRKLLKENIDRLHSVFDTGEGLSFDPLGDLNEVIESLYLEDETILATIEELQQLVGVHKRISEQSHMNRQSLAQLETRIFGLLGFKEKTPGHQELILVVDDLSDNLDILEGALTHQGYQVATARHGAAAIDKARTLCPDIILLDVSMPGMDGFTVCKTLKGNQITTEIPILFLSASNSTKDKVKGFEVGGNDYITKPFQFEEVLARVKHQLQLASLQKRLAQQNENFQKELLAHKDMETLYHGMFNHAADGMFQASVHGTYLRVNKALAQLYGYASPKVMLSSIANIASQLYVESNRQRELMNTINAKGTLGNFESQVYREDGSIIWISESARMVRDTAGKFLYYEGIVRDITVYKQSQLSPAKVSA